MKELVPSKIITVSVIFLTVLYLTSDIIPAIILSLAVFMALHNFLKLGGIFLFTLLIYPLVGGYLAAALGYGAFVIVLGKFHDGRYAFGLAMLFLIFCPIMLVFKKNDVAESSAIFAYIFLLTGLIQEGIKWARTPKTEDVENMEFKQINV